MTVQQQSGRRRIGLALLLCLALLLTFAFAGRDGDGREGAHGRPIGLFTSLPILWRETDSVTGLLNGEAPAHWALAVMERHGEIHPLDTLAGKDGNLPLGEDGILVLAQPRPLAPQENVALDAWVRAGGRALLFADPMLTAHSRFAPGDNRRPQDIVLLSPILKRWGLELQFAETQPYGEDDMVLFGGHVPVNLPGRFAALAGSSCTIESPSGLAALCRIGRGEVLAIADAALLEDGAAETLRDRRAMLDRLLTLIAG